MLLESDDRPDDEDKVIYQSTKSILFLGTPHRGSDKSTLARHYLAAAKVMGFCTADQNVKDLEANSRVLDYCHSQFQLLKEREKYKVFTFYETKPTPPSRSGLVLLHLVILGSEVLTLGTFRSSNDTLHSSPEQKPAPL